ncbi:MAG TPA: hypothetical protein VGN52_14305, partial [Burkholderiales bacterium]
MVAADGVVFAGAFAIKGASNCLYKLAGEVSVERQGVSFFSMALRVMSSLCMQATMATFLS